MQERLVSETITIPRQTILEFIAANPGSHFRKIQKKLMLPLGTLQYNLKILEREKKIKSVKTKFYKNYYLSNESDEIILSVLNLETPKKILMLLEQLGPLTHGQISTTLGLTSSTISWQMKKLVNLDLVRVHHEGKYKIYGIKSKNQVKRCLYKKQFYKPKLVVAS